MESNLTLTLEALAPTGAVFTTEQVSAFQYSLPLKKIEAGLSTLQVGMRVERFSFPCSNGACAK